MTGIGNLRRLNDKLLGGLTLATDLRARLSTLPATEVETRLDAVLTFLRCEVVPRARAEERVFYPEVARVIGVDLGERMLAEHHDVERLLFTLEGAQEAVSATGEVPDELYRDLGALVDLVRAHLRLESEAIDAMVDAGFTDTAADLLYEEMELASFDAVAAAR